MAQIELREIDETNLDAVLSIAVRTDQEVFVGGGVADALADADAYPEANPWYRAIYADATPVGFVMLSWDVVPQPPAVIGPWYLWKLLIDAQHQRCGHGRAAVGLVIDLVRREGAAELLTSYAEGQGDPGLFYQGLGFTPTGERDENNEIILAYRL